MEVYPGKMDGTLLYARSVHFFLGGGGISPSNEKSLLLFLIQLLINMSLNEFYVNVVNGVNIDVANDILPVWWMEVYPFRFHQSKSLLHAEI